MLEPSFTVFTGVLASAKLCRLACVLAPSFVLFTCVLALTFTVFTCLLALSFAALAGVFASAKRGGDERVQLAFHEARHES